MDKCTLRRIPRSFHSRLKRSTGTGGMFRSGLPQQQPLQTRRCPSTTRTVFSSPSQRVTSVKTSVDMQCTLHASRIGGNAKHMGILVAQYETRAADRVDQFHFMVAIDLSAKSCDVYINDVVQCGACIRILPDVTGQRFA